jgi:hypothetical protein
MHPMFCPGEEGLLQIAWPSSVLAVALEEAGPTASAAHIGIKLCAPHEPVP